MNSQIAIKSLIVGLMLGALLILTVAAVTGTPVTTKWEYMVVDQKLLNSAGTRVTPQVFEQAINQRAGEGWELAGFSRDSQYGFTAVLKRARP